MLVVGEVFHLPVVGWRFPTTIPKLTLLLPLNHGGICKLLGTLQRQPHSLTPFADKWVLNSV